ncbi:MAG: YkgJ family cysteine cluster protein [Verrucomicrobiia bacterium]
MFPLRGSPLTSPTISFDPHQRFACRDCPARCCKNWSITASAAEVEVLMALPWVQQRLAAHQARLVPLRKSSGKRFRLPMVSRGAELRCIFLDDDDLCSIHRREGHDKLPAICQSFPFTFVQEQPEVIKTSLSTYCPSIRDNYGELLAGQIESKLAQASPFLVHLPEVLALGSHRLTRSDYLALADFWVQALFLDHPPAYILGALRDHLTLLSEVLGPGDPTAVAPTPLPQDWSVEASGLLSDLLAQQPSRTGIYQPNCFPLATRGLLSVVLVAISDPTFRAVVEPKPYRFLPGMVRNLIALATGALPLRMENIPQPARLDSLAWRVRGPGPEDQPLIRKALADSVKSRLAFARADSLPEVLFMLAAGLAVTHLYARLRAAADQRDVVSREDVREAVSMADKICLRHGNLLRVLPVSRLVLGLLAHLPNAHEHLLVACLPDPRTS